MPTEYIIQQSGAIVRRETIDVELEMVDSVINDLCVKSKKTCPNAFEVDGLACHLCLGKEIYVTTVLPALTFCASFKAAKEMIVPSFTSKTDPTMTLLWSPPTDMVLKFLVVCTAAGEFGSAFLFAYNSKGTAWRLPLPNIHDDCRICMGTFNPNAENVAQIVHNCLRQLSSSNWNSDLLKSVENSQRMFRWKPQGPAFDILPPDGEWTKLCNKVSAGVMEFIL